MRKVLIACLLLISVAVLVIYGLWTGQRPMGHYLSDLRAQVVIDEGRPGARGNLLGIEPDLFPSDYQDLGRLHRKLAAYLQQARDKGLISSKTVAVLPEHVGTWLFATHEKNQFYRAESQDEAMDWLAWSNPLKFIMALPRTQGDNRLDDARMRLKARSMAEDYQRLFGGLAREFGITLVAGSIILPDPQLVDGQLNPGNGALYNVSLTFGSDGRPLAPPQRQIYPSHHRRRYVSAASDAPLQVVDTPAGRLAVLIGSDSWYPAAYARLSESGAELIAIPASVNGNSGWSDRWRGHRDQSARANIDVQGAQLTEEQAWHRLTLTGRAGHSTAHASVSVFMHGQFWDQRSVGQSFVSHDGGIVPQPPAQQPSTSGARLINVWL
ncbi:carbon-nitrogen hydrolase family protein [Pseudomonas sp. JDS28PS106]|uniref:carbon-nitrogen hydrolase family protein n=1 Tax=Pseudomonas sp. JDS28PS106 TaxID=2497235 RepID=UPI002FD26CB8